MFENDCGYKKNKCCIDLIIFILSILAAVVVGLLIGAFTGIIVLLNLGTIIAVLAILILLIILRIINLICNKEKKNKCC